MTQGCGRTLTYIWMSSWDEELQRERPAGITEWGGGGGLGKEHETGGRRGEEVTNHHHVGARGGRHLEEEGYGREG